MSKEFVEQSYWDDSYRAIDFAIAPPQDALRIWLEKVIPAGSGSCFEVGCFPGRYLAVIGELGYQVNGIDLTPRVQEGFSDWMKGRGISVGELFRGDIRDMRIDRKFDLVCSFGFVEHFADWEGVIRKHIEVLAPGGTLVVTAPNFRGEFQRFLRRWLDSENLDRHNLDAMRPQSWARIARDSGLKVDFAGYFGKFDFWVDHQDRNELQMKVIRKILLYRKYLEKIPAGTKIFSPYCGLVAKMP